MGGGAVQSAEQQLDNALEEERDSGDLVAQHDYTDITSYFKDDGTGNPSVGETLDGCTILDSSQFGGKTAAQWIAGLDELVQDGWTTDAGWSQSGRTFTASGVGGNTEAESADLLIDGETYWAEIQYSGLSSGSSWRFYGFQFTNTLDISEPSDGASGRKVIVFEATGTSTITSIRSLGNGSGVFTLSIKHLPGNHTVASGAGPTLRQTSGMYYTETNGTDDALTMALPARRSLLTYTEDFSNAAWSKSAVSVGAHDDGGFGLITADGTNAQHYIQHSESWPDTATGTVSFKVKAATANFVHVLCTGDNRYAQFDLSDGSLVYSSGITSSSATAIPGGWRITVTLLTTGSGRLLRVYPLAASNNTAGPSEASAASISIGEIQLEAGSTATDYQSIGSDWMDDMMVSIAFRTSDTQGRLVASGSTNWLGQWQASNPNADITSGTLGSVTYRLDGAAWSPTTRADFATGAADNDWHVVTGVGADIGSLVELVLGYSSASNAFNAAYDVVGLVIAPNTTANIELAEAALAKAMEPVGYALAA